MGDPWGLGGTAALVGLVVVAILGFSVLHVGVLAAGWVRRVARRATGTRAPPPRGGHSMAGPAPRLTLTYVVSVYNDALTIGPCIESLLKQTRRPDRILIVDDGSTDGTAEVIDAYRPRGVHAVHLPRNVGKTRALEAALRVIDTDLVAITDADSLVHEAYVERIVPAFHDPRVAAVGGILESIPHTWVTAARQVEYVTGLHLVRRAEADMDSIFVLVGSATTYRTSILKTMGFEHDTIAEDLDLTFRLHAAGHVLRLEPRAKVFVSDPPTLRDYHKQLDRWYTDFWIVVRKHHRLLGKRTFGTIEYPGIVVSETLASAAYVASPFVLLTFDPRAALAWFLIGLAADVLLILGSSLAWRRQDVWWSLLSRTPMRFIARTTFLYTMVRVLVGRPGTRWQKLARLETHTFANRRPPASPEAGR